MSAAPPRKRGRPKGRVPGSFRSMAEAAAVGGTKGYVPSYGVSEASIRRMARFLDLLEKYPFMESGRWTQRQAFDYEAMVKRFCVTRDAENDEPKAQP